MENGMIKEKSRLNLNTTGLNEKMNLWAEELNMTVTDLARKALGEFIEKLERNKIEREIADACKFYYRHDKQIAEEWKTAESRIE
jgi:archaellum component FlaD/FlaE